ncbi:MAG: type IV pili methyl-accepting chemotaxis transducer N-terminal domain-containing protein [Litoreibacter sp.]|nr:type IV pili methyl-accepting chemotaxis transducer N-terminal domain-containing protein [Litoreibacter sp.]
MSVTTVGQALGDRAEAERRLAAIHDADILTIGEESDGADRIRYSERLSMLTQRVAAASCSLTSDVAIEESHFHLEEAMHEMDIILEALRVGNEKLHIFGPEKRKRTLHDIDELEEEWKETHGAVEAVLADGHDVDNAHIIDDHNLSLLKKAQVLASDISGQYSHPYELTQSHAMLLSIAGRQRMLTQKMAKDACEVWTGYHAEDGRADLIETMSIYENSLNALLNGMPAAGILAAPTPQIQEDLHILLDRWAIIKANLVKLIDGETLDMDQKYEIFHDLNLELDDLEHLIHDYKEFTEAHHT